MKGIITVDVGTTSMRAILYGADGAVVHVHQEENAPTFFPDGRVEQAPQAWSGILVKSLKTCATALEVREQQQAICTGRRPGCIGIDGFKGFASAVERFAEPAVDGTGSQYGCLDDIGVRYR